MITFTITYPNGTIVTRNVFASQAQMIINAMRRDGCVVAIVSNQTDYIIR